VHNSKNTINLQNAILQQKKETQVIVKFKELKKRKVMNNLQKKASMLKLVLASATKLSLKRCR